MAKKDTEKTLLIIGGIAVGLMLLPKAWDYIKTHFATQLAKWGINVN